jgi:DNA helicase IV
VRAALDGDFPPRGMVAIAAVRDVKGLEFDHVFVPDASAAAYPDTPADRRALYVAVTRATHSLTLATGADWSPVLPPER